MCANWVFNAPKNLSPLLRKMLKSLTLKMDNGDVYYLWCCINFSPLISSRTQKPQSKSREWNSNLCMSLFLWAGCWINVENWRFKTHSKITRARIFSCLTPDLIAVAALTNIMRILTDSDSQTPSGSHRLKLFNCSDQSYVR